MKAMREMKVQTMQQMSAQRIAQHGQKQSSELGRMTGRVALSGEPRA
ncbi:hypothetical protein [Orrella marina]|nr:hypothetical protein [Orrella marina]